jgi:hypothetical protein
MSETSIPVESVLEELEVFFGAANNAEAAVYVQLPKNASLPDDVQITGSVNGPGCKYAHTLPATVALRNLDPGPFSLAEARIPDPCFWTPEEPYLYTVEVTAQLGEEVLATQRRTLAIRRLGVQRNSLFLDAKRWVPRAVAIESSSAPSLDDCHAATLGCVVDDPSDDMCGQATQIGVLLVAKITTDAGDVTAEVQRLARFGAVGFVIVENPPPATDEMSNVARNVVLCHLVCDDRSGDTLPSWAETIVYEVEDLQRAAQFAAECALPVIAWRRSAETNHPAAARVACDALQRDLAPHGDFAGYFV